MSIGVGEGLETIKSNAFANAMLPPVKLSKSLKTLHYKALAGNIDEQRNPIVVKLYIENED